MPHETVHRVGGNWISENHTEDFSKGFSTYTKAVESIKYFYSQAMSGIPHSKAFYTNVWLRHDSWRWTNKDYICEIFFGFEWITNVIRTFNRNW